MAKSSNGRSRKKEQGQDKAVEAAMAQIEKQYGKGAIMRLGDQGGGGGGGGDHILRFAGAGCGSGHRRISQRPDRRNLRAGRRR